MKANSTVKGKLNSGRKGLWFLPCSAPSLNACSFHPHSPSGRMKVFIQLWGEIKQMWDFLQGL